MLLYFFIFSNVSHIQTAQIAPKLNNGTEKPRFGSANGCPRCGKQVYFAEEKRALGKKWHKICLSCRKYLLYIYQHEWRWGMCQRDNN